MLVLFGACADPSAEWMTNLSNVKVDMTREEVIAIMGPPQRHELHGSTEFLIYATDGKSTTALLDFTPVAIVDGRVTGIGRGLYEAVVRARTK